MAEHDAIFEEQRPRLERFAYRMLGSRSDVDDVLQEAFLRWNREDRDDVQSAAAYLSSIVARLCIDQRRAIDMRKATYIGPWLPEPIIESAGADPVERLETVDSISMAFLLVLESLTPVERAAFLLRKVFDYGYDEIGAILEKSTPNCRQLVHRAEQAIQEHRPRFEPDPAEAERMTSAFLQACTSGDLADLLQLLADDAVVYSDGGGKATAARAPVSGALNVARFFVGITKKMPPEATIKRARVNGQPGIIISLAGQPVTVVTLDLVDGRIAHCYAIRNPEKLARVN
ncbi:MAG TPA: RNA polymerase sigma-70 factor [Pirellulales bacterium]|jgi:RNA polymerase sigma-70 factor (ECF subfamily)